MSINPLRRASTSLPGTLQNTIWQIRPLRLIRRRWRGVCSVDGGRRGRREPDPLKRRRQTERDQRLKDIAASLSKKDGTVAGRAAGALHPQPANTGIGVFWLCMVNYSLFVLDHVFRLPWVPSLYLNHQCHRWWQFLTSAFCHSDWQHLSSNIFMLYIFGKLVEEEEGALGVWSTYIICAVGANLVSVHVSPYAISLGASAAVFGLFIVSVLLKLSWNIKRLLEGAILGQFVYQQVTQELKSHVAGGVITASGHVNHLAHLCGALVGALLVLLLKQLPEPETGE